MTARFTSIYNTQDELDFLKNIGNFRIIGKKKYTRRQLLEFYRETMEKRINWDKIEKDIIAEYIERELNK
jgi:hypothetical protein